MATGTTTFVNNTTATAFIPTLWSPIAIVAREKSLVGAAVVDRRYEEGLRYGATINVPSIGNLAARTKTVSGGAAITFETITETNTSISIATWEYSAIAVESIIAVQANRDMLVAYAGKLGYALGLSTDTAVGANIASLTTNITGVKPGELTDDDWLRARQYLNDAFAPMTERYIVISPAAESGLLKLDRFVHDDYSSIHGEVPRETDLENAYLRSWYRMPVYVTANVAGSNSAGHDNYMLHREALALVMQMKPTVRYMYDINYFVDKVAMENVYGTAIMRDNHAVWLKGP